MYQVLHKNFCAGAQCTPTNRYIPMHDFDDHLLPPGPDKPLRVVTQHGHDYVSVPIEIQYPGVVI